MRKIILRMVIAGSLALLLVLQQASGQVTRLPAYPLITHDPYFSVWCFSDELNASDTRHWTGAAQPMLGFLKVDDSLYRFIGKPGRDDSSVTMLGGNPAQVSPAGQQW